MRWNWQRAVVVAAAIAVVASAGFVAARVVGTSGGQMTLDLYAARTDLNGTDVAWDLYVLGDSEGSPAPQGDPVGRMLAHCTVIVSNQGICQGFINLKGRGTLAVYKLDTGSGFTALAVLPGTGEFAGATGTLEVSAGGNPNDRVYHFELTGLGGQ